MFGLVFGLSGTAAVLNTFEGATPPKYFVVLVLSGVGAAWLLGAIFALGDVSAHFDPAITFAFALRGDITWAMTVIYWVVQFTAAASASLLIRALMGDGGGLAATRPAPATSGRRSSWRSS